MEQEEIVLLCQAAGFPNVNNLCRSRSLLNIYDNTMILICRTSPFGGKNQMKHTQRLCLGRRQRILWGLKYPTRRKVNIVLTINIRHLQSHLFYRLWRPDVSRDQQHRRVWALPSRGEPPPHRGQDRAWGAPDHHHHLLRGVGNPTTGLSGHLLLLPQEVCCK